MTDLELAKRNLAGHTICLCKDGKLLTSDKRGISPMMDFIEEGRDVAGYSVADKIVGKAAAFLFVLARVREVYAEVLSAEGKRVLDENGIPCSFSALTDKIINRKGDGMCPMETLVQKETDPERAYALLKKKLSENS